MQGDTNLVFIYVCGECRKQIFVGIDTITKGERETFLFKVRGKIYVVEREA